MISRLSGRANILIWLFLSCHLATKTFARDGFVPKVESQDFDTQPVDIRYFEDSEVILTREVNGNIWRSDDAGLNWNEINDIRHGEAVSFWMNPYHKKWAVALGREGKHWVTNDRGQSWRDFSLPDGFIPAFYRLPLSFHAFDPEKVIFKVQDNRQADYKERAYYTENGFKDVKLLHKDARECIWVKGTPQVKPAADDKALDNRVLCIVGGDKSRAPEENRILLSDDYFSESKTPKEPIMQRGFINLAGVKGYIVASAKAEDSTELSMMISADGENWHRALFSPEYKLHEDYTVLESNDFSIQIDALNPRSGSSMGVLFSSDSNGTYFSQNMRHINRNMEGLTDFEQVTGIQGIIIMNTVKNWEDIEMDFRTQKKLVSKISFDNGRTWNNLKSRNGDTIHLHSITNMADNGKVFTSPAVGLVMGVGNAGDSLKHYGQGNLWVSNDAGLTWSEALDGPHKYEFGDQGTVIVAVDSEHRAKEIKYSLNHGDDWMSFKFTNDAIQLAVLTTIPDSTTQKFTLTALRQSNSKTFWSIYTIDFTGVYDRKCHADDLEDWSAPDADGKSSCIMGHTQTYRRRQKKAHCYMGEKFKEATATTKSCLCSYKDYECDVDYVPEGDGESRICVPASSPSHEACKNGKDVFESPSGFRLIPGNTCKDGVKKDQEKIDRPCDPAKKPTKSKGFSGLAFFLVAIILPISAAVGIVWSRIQSGSRTGRIRLGEITLSSSAFDASQPWVRYPVAIISGAIAILIAVPLLIGAGWRALSSRFGSARRYTGRKSFAIGREDYSIVGNGDALLGDYTDDEEI